jgi:hypothetical protein
MSQIGIEKYTVAGAKVDLSNQLVVPTNNEPEEHNNRKQKTSCENGDLIAHESFFCAGISFEEFVCEQKREYFL